MILEGAAASPGEAAGGAAALRERASTAAQLAEVLLEGLLRACPVRHVSCSWVGEKLYRCSVASSFKTAWAVLRHAAWCMSQAATVLAAAAGSAGSAPHQAAAEPAGAAPQLSAAQQAAAIELAELHQQLCSVARLRDGAASMEAGGDAWCCEHLQPAALLRLGGLAEAGMQRQQPSGSQLERRAQRASLGCASYCACSYSHSLSFAECSQPASLQVWSSMLTYIVVCVWLTARSVSAWLRGLRRTCWPCSRPARAWAARRMTQHSSNPALCSRSSWRCPSTTSAWR